MENLIHKITIREWNYFSKSLDISVLKRYGINKKNIETLIQIVDENLGETMDFDKETHKLSSKFRIQELITYYKNLHSLMVHQLKVELMLLELNIEKKLNEDLDNVIKAKAEQLKSKYEIEVITLEDLSKIEDEIQRRLDKYSELTKDSDIEIKGVTFPELVIAVFRNLGYDKIDYDMVLSDFFELKKQAAKAVK